MSDSPTTAGDTDSDGSSECEQLLTPSEPEVSFELLRDVKDKISLFLNKRFVPIIHRNSLHVVQISVHSNLSIQRTLVFHPSGRVELYVHCKQVSAEPFLDKVSLPIELKHNEFAMNCFVDRCIEIINNVRQMEICSGFDDEKYKRVWDKCPFGKIDENPYQECRYNETFRSVTCKLLVSGDKWKCTECSKLGPSLRRRAAVVSGDPHPCTPNIFLSEEQKLKKLEEQKRQLNAANRKITRLQKRMQDLLKKEGVNIDRQLSKDLTDILKSSDISPAQSIFMQQQVKASQLKNKCGMRWHPTMLRFALALHLSSPAAYETARDTGMIKLPSKRTLFDYSHAKPHKDGVDDVVLNSLAERVSDMPKSKRYHVLMADEMFISKNLVLQKSSGRLIGYTNLDNIDKEVKTLEEFLDNPDKEDPECEETEASAVLVYMVKGVSNGMKEVVATYAVSHPSVNQMYHWTWEVIGALERSNVHVIAMVTDGFSTNRAFIRRHKPVTKLPSGVVFDTINKAARDRVLYFISDVPHLMKTIRNCLYNSRFDKKKGRRKMMKNGQKISWGHIIKLYEKYKDRNLRKTFKLNPMNVYPDSYGRMKVKYAAEVVSLTVAQHLEDEGWSDASELINFLRVFNNWFDCLNGAHSSVGRKKKNKLLEPYTQASFKNNSEDTRFQLLNDVLQYLEDWKEEASRSPNQTADCSVLSSSTAAIPEDEESAVFEGVDDPSTETPACKRLLSRETLEGIEMSTRAIMGAIKFLLGEGVEFINARIFSQDPLEQHFSKIRGGLGGSTAPNVGQVLSKNRAIHLIGQLGMKRRKGNAAASDDWVEVTTERLPKRQCNRVPKLDR